MDIEKVVENIQRACMNKGVTPTLAGRESGAGKDMLSAMKRRGILPSIEKMSLLAEYLGVTVSDLLGEGPSTGLLPTQEEQEFTRLFFRLSPDQRKLIIAQLQGIVDAKEKQSTRRH